MSIELRGKYLNYAGRTKHLVIRYLSDKMIRRTTVPGFIYFAANA